MCHKESPGEMCGQRIMHEVLITFRSFLKRQGSMAKWAMEFAH